MAGGLGALAVGDIARMVADAPPIAAQPLGDMLGGVVEGAVGVGRLPFPAQAQPAPGMHVDVAGEEAARPAERDLRLQRVIEVFAGNPLQVPGDPLAQRLGQFDLLAGNVDLHPASPR